MSTACYVYALAMYASAGLGFVAWGMLMYQSLDDMVEMRGRSRSTTALIWSLAILWAIAVVTFAISHYGPCASK